MKFDKQSLSIDVKFYEFDNKTETQLSIDLDIREDESIRKFVDRIETTIKQFIKEEK